MESDRRFDMEHRKVYYFDNNATTRVAPEVVEAMVPFLSEYWGNPSSSYHFGRQVAKHVEAARAKVAELINADPREVIFTSCGTEGNNSAINSALVSQPGKRHVLTTAVEHSANMKFGAALQKRGYEVTYLPVESDGALDIHLLEKSIRPDTAIVSVMWANNETGVIFPIEEIAAICRSKGVLCHTDAVQTPGKLKIDVAELGVDMMSLSAHKLHAPKGIGALYVKKRTKYHPYLIGRRAGAGAARRDGERGGHGGVRARGGTGDGEPGGREHAGEGVARPDGENDSGDDSRCDAEREPAASVAEHEQSVVWRYRGGGDFDRVGQRGDLRVERIGVHDGVAGAIACADGDGVEGGAGAGVNPVEPGDL